MTTHASPEGLPTGLPSADPNATGLPPVRRLHGPDAGGKVNVLPVVSPLSTRSPSAAAERARPNAQTRGPGSRRLGLTASALNPRDLEVLASLSTHRFLSSDHLYVFHFADHASVASGQRTVRRVLRRLARDELVAELPRRVGGFLGGAASTIWHLTLTGYRLLAVAQAVGSATTPAVRVREPSLRLVDHCLAVADAHVGLLVASRSNRFKLGEMQAEPQCWRRYPGSMGEPLTLKPDLFAVTRSADGQYEDSWFLEIDLGTEHPPTVVNQCRQYEAYLATGREQADDGVFPLVVWITRSQQRADKLRAALKDARSLQHELYRVVTTGQLANLVASGESGQL